MVLQVGLGNLSMEKKRRWRRGGRCFTSRREGASSLTGAEDECLGDRGVPTGTAANGPGPEVLDGPAGPPGCRAWPGARGDSPATALLNGKMYLSQAEAVADLIRARSEGRIEVAQPPTPRLVRAQECSELTERACGG